MEFEQALRNILGDRFDDLAVGPKSVLREVWDAARASLSVPVSPQLTLTSLLEVRDVFHDYLSKAYLQTFDGEHNVKHTIERYNHICVSSVPAMAPAPPFALASCVGFMESDKIDPLMWVANPGDFADILMFHLEHHTTGIIRLETEVPQVAAVLWNLPILKSTKVPPGEMFLVGVTSPPPSGSETTHEHEFGILHGNLRTVILRIMR